MQKFDNDKKEIIFTTDEPCTRLKAANCECKIIYRNVDCQVLFIENKCLKHMIYKHNDILEKLKG